MSRALARDADEWLDLGKAADLLGVHYTTLRRWADEYRIPVFRTPGGHRRFKRADLAHFLEQSQTRKYGAPFAMIPSAAQVRAAGEPLFGKFSPAQRAALRGEGRHMFAVLLQYTSRSNGGEAFLQEGRRMATTYGIMCRMANLSLVETVHAFVRMRRTIVESLQEASAQAGSADADTWRLFDRVNHFLDSMLLATLEAYENEADEFQDVSPT